VYNITLTRDTKHTQGTYYGTVRGCGPFDATNASKHSIDQSEDRILQINQSKNASKHS